MELVGGIGRRQVRCCGTRCASEEGRANGRRRSGIERRLASESALVERTQREAGARIGVTSEHREGTRSGIAGWQGHV